MISYYTVILTEGHVVRDAVRRASWKGSNTYSNKPI